MRPNGVLKDRPPAKGAPPGRVWQLTQFPAAARYRPRSTSWWAGPATALASACAAGAAAAIGSMSPHSCRPIATQSMAERITDIAKFILHAETGGWRFALIPIG